MLFGFWKRRRRKRLLATPIPESLLLHLPTSVRRWREIHPQRREKLQQIAWILFHELRFEGSRGFEVTDEMKWTVTTNVALMLLGVQDYYFEGVRTVLIQPEPFELPQRGRWIVSQVSSAGAAWQFGPIVLSWADCQVNSHLRRNGRNVIVHEFAHHLDGIDGEMGGSIQLPTRELADQWNVRVAQEMEQLQRAINAGTRTFLDHYAATNPAEFFAVASEYFFERPVEMQVAHPDIYSLLTQFYHTDPQEWSKSESE